MTSSVAFLPWTRAYAPGRMLKGAFPQCTAYNFDEVYRENYLYGKY
jgi:hypothetical protein